MERPQSSMREQKIIAIKRLRSFAGAIIEIARKRDASPPPTAVKVMDATPQEMYDAQHRQPLTEEDLLYWQAVMNQEYNEAIDQRYGVRLAPKGGVPLPITPLIRRNQTRFGGET